MTALTIIRYIAFSVSLAFSAAVVGLGAHMVWITNNLWIFPDMGLASGGLTLILLTTLIIFGSCSKNSFPTMVAFELASLGVLWVLWVATGALAAIAYQAFYGGACGGVYFDVTDAEAEVLDMVCQESAAVTAFSFLTWLTLMGYWVILLIFASIGSVRGYPSFTSSVMTTNFLAPRAGKKTEYALSTTMSPQFTGKTDGSYPSQAPPQQFYNGQAHYHPNSSVPQV